MALLGFLLLFFHRKVPHWPLDVVIHLAFVIGGLEIIRLGETSPLSLLYLSNLESARMIPGFAEKHSTDYTGYLVASFVRFVQSLGSVRDACFPPSHVSASLAWTLAAWRHNRAWSYVLMFMVFGVAVSTVYLRYHHAVDPIAGLIWGLTCYWVAVAILRKRNEDPA